MKKLIGYLLAAALCLFLGPAAFAQGHGNGGHGGRGHAGGYHGGGYQGNRGGYRGERSHFDGRHFDRDYRGRYFGRGHVFVAGPRYAWGGGFRFFYGGFWFGYDAWPVAWGLYDPVYVDCDGDVYYLYDPWYPGTRVVLTVVF